jgi:hypothetical protein
VLLNVEVVVSVSLVVSNEIGLLFVTSIHCIRTVVNVSLYSESAKFEDVQIVQSSYGRGPVHPLVDLELMSGSVSVYSRPLCSCSVFSSHSSSSVVIALNGHGHFWSCLNS